ncbi:MAG: DUF2188 domain-containing protein [Planctomycetes bacterium]|jgi:hypothetical protein|nr:DUF2188 domain-containing protein [Planctomycetota bacterium]
MNILIKYTLSHNRDNKNWELKEDKTKEILVSFPIKKRALSKGVLKKVLGNNGGSVKVKNIKGGFQEERTFPRSKDPKKSEG